MSTGCCGRYRRKSVGKREGRNPVLLGADFMTCFLRYGCGLSDYLNYELWDKTGEQRREYVTIRDTEEFYERVSPSRYKDFFSLKNNFLTNFAPYIRRGFFVPAQGNLEEMERFLHETIDALPGVVSCSCNIILSRIKDIKGLRL